MANKSIADRLLSAFKGMEFTLKQAYTKCTGVNNESVRARIYENLGVKFLRVRKGVYVAKDQDCVLFEKVHELCDKICDRLGLSAPVVQTAQ